ncbi:hypothetical protein L1887_44249 [Cichorium endivia]|nr:hypothetical protein L1887_44249 [Cichorium endivia]
MTLLLAGCSGSKSSDMGSYSGSVYTVKRGDTLYRISRATGTSVKDLARLNNLSPPYTIEVGQKLKVSGGSSSGKKSSSKGKTAKVTPSYQVPQSSWPPVDIVMLLIDNFKDVIARAPYSALNYQTPSEFTAR